MQDGFALGLVGATGAVGREFLTVLDDRRFPVRELRLFASARSAGSTVPFRGSDVRVDEIEPCSFHGLDLAFFSAGSACSRAHVPQALGSGAFVVDNSSSFRMDPGVPLIVPEVNADSLAGSRLVSVPNCSAILLLMAVAPLRGLGHIERLVVSTYQSASGGGAALMQELEDQTAQVLAGRPAEPRVAPHVYAFNLFSHNSPVGDDGSNDEERKIAEECRKILDRPDLRIHATCVRVPVLRAHCESVVVEFSGPAPSPELVREVLTCAPGVRVVDDPAANRFPMPSEASGRDEVLVGRIRRDSSHPSAIALFLCGDQLRKGAALTGVQIAELALGLCPAPAL